MFQQHKSLGVSLQNKYAGEYFEKLAQKKNNKSSRNEQDDRGSS
jgi:hypothetical protein